MEPKAAGGPAHVFATPVVPGKEETWRRFLQEVAASRVEYERLREHLGVRRELVWLVPFVRGYATVAYLEIDGDLDEFVRRLVATNEAFDLWFKEGIVECHGRYQSMESLVVSALDPVFSWGESPGEGGRSRRAHVI